MSDLDEEDREVVDEDEGGGEAVGELHDVVVRHPSPLLAGNDLEQLIFHHVYLHIIKITHSEGEY